MNPAMGGPCQGIRYMAPMMNDKGIQNTVACLDDPKASFLGEDPFPIHALGPAKSSWAYSAMLKPWLLKNLGDFDAVIQHGLWQYPGYALYKVMHSLRKSGRPDPHWYIYPHGMLDPWFQNAASRRLKAMRNWFYWKIIENRVIRSADGLLFTCEEELRLAATTFRPYRPKMVYNTGYGIPEPPGEPEQQTENFFKTFQHLRGRNFLLFLSRIHPKKGVDLLIKAYGELKRQGIFELPHLVISGPCADPRYWGHLQSLAVSLKLQNAPIRYQDFQGNSPRSLSNSSDLTWTGMVEGDTKWGALRSASVFILPSHQENFGIAVVEALACGTPVMISNKVNIWREIESDGAGIVFPDTLQGLLPVLEEYCLNRTIKENKEGKAPREAFNARYTLESAYSELYNILM